MAFAINFWYDPEKNKKDFTEGKPIQWKTFKANEIKYTVISEGDNLILKAHPGAKEETIVLSYSLAMDPDQKHMVVLTSDDKTVTVHLDNVSVKQIGLPKIEKPKKPKPKKPKPKKPKAKKAKVKKSKPKKTKSKESKPKKPKPKKSKPKKLKPKETKPKKVKIKKPKRLKPKKFKPNK